MYQMTHLYMEFLHIGKELKLFWSQVNRISSTAILILEGNSECAAHAKNTGKQKFQMKMHANKM